jgi:hypothetical protein
MAMLDAAKIATRLRQPNIPDLLGAPRQPWVAIREEDWLGKINKTFKLGIECATAKLSSVQSKRVWAREHACKSH